MPKHVAIVMDGNGRWAKERFMPRIAGHRVGAKAVRKAIQFCVRHQIDVLSLFALSVENFLSRPESEIHFLLSLFSDALLKDIVELHEHNIRIRIIGDHSAFDQKLKTQIDTAQTMTKDNTGLTLIIAVNYSGRWDMLQAAKKLAKHVLINGVDPEAMTEADYAKYICLHDLPEPDLLIRTGGDQRISNFMLWQFAYTELYFSDVYWPDFDEELFAKAVASYQKRERRFGLTGEQIAVKESHVDH